VRLHLRWKAPSQQVHKQWVWTWVVCTRRKAFHRCFGRGGFGGQQPKAPSLGDTLGGDGGLAHGVGGSSLGHGSPSTIQILVTTGGRVWSFDPGKRGLGTLQTM